MGVVHYRYRSGVQTFSVPVPGAFASVAELRRLIAATGRHGRGRTRGRGPREGIALCDPRTGEGAAYKYVDENTLIPQNSTVLVHRVAGHPTDAIITSSLFIKGDGMVPNEPASESTLKSKAFTVTDVEEMAAIRSVIDAADIKWGGSSSGSGDAGGRLGCHYGIRPLEGETPPPGYVCRICHIPGHFIQHCTSQIKPPPPGYVCYKCGVPGHFIHCCPNYGDRKYARRTYSLTPIVSSFDDGIQTEAVQAMSCSVGDSLPAELHCPLCKKVMTDAMLTSKCCFDSFCDKCIRDYIISQSKCVCGVRILADDLIPNHTLRTTITSMLSSSGGCFSSDAGKFTSSTSSNFDAKSHSFAASTVLNGETKQHEDNVPSVTTKGSDLITAGTNPADLQKILTRSDLQSKAGKSARTSTKNTIATVEAVEAVPEPRCQKQSPPDGIAVVSGVFERKVIRIKSKKKQKKAGTTGSGSTNCAEYDCCIPVEPSYYDSYFGLGGLPWGADPYNMYFMPDMPFGGYPMGLYNGNDISNLPLHALGMQGYPPNYHSWEFQPRAHEDQGHGGSAHGRQAESGKRAGLQPHISEHYPSTSTRQRRSRSRSRSTSVSERQDSRYDSHDYDEDFHSRKKGRAHLTRSPVDGDHRSQKSGSRHSSRRLACEDSNDDKRSPMDGDHRIRRKSSLRHSSRRLACEDSSDDTRSPMDGDRRISRKSSLRHSSRRLACEDSSDDTKSPMYGDHYGNRKSSSRHSSRRLAYEDSGDDTRSPMDGDNHRSQKSSSRHSSRRLAYEDSSDDESNFKRRW
ncbi:hypothetical protein ACP70R_033245 [Stipagrostis hirtigluma subsp. patula]